MESKQLWSDPFLYFHVQPENISASPVLHDISMLDTSPSSALTPNMPNMLNPGELIRTSGKFGKPTKIPGKNYSKDEVVIRNADSGKGEICSQYIFLGFNSSEVMVSSEYIYFAYKMGFQSSQWKKVFKQVWIRVHVHTFYINWPYFSHSFCCLSTQKNTKVMGIKGRRVHMIEELSETIISFQRGKNWKESNQMINI